MEKFKKVDIGIVTIIPEIELPSVLRSFQLSPKSQEHTLIYGNRYWFSSVISKKMNKEFTSVITAIGTSGNIPSSAATTSLIQQFHPDLLIMVGIAAGIQEKVNILDVVVSEKVLGYEPGRLTQEGMKQRPQSEHPPFQVLQDARFFIQSAEDVGWLTLFDTFQSKLDHNQLPPSLLTGRPKVNMGTIASGEKLFADGSLNNIRKQYDEKIMAGEMEGIGFAIAAERVRIPWIIVRGISDFGDPSTKDGRYRDKYHFSAANSAAAWTVKFLEYAYSGYGSERENRSAASDNNKSPANTRLINVKTSEQILDRIKNIIASHGLDDDNWAKAISSQYFLVGVAELLGIMEQSDYKNLLNKFLRSFYRTIDDKIILEKNHILVTPEELKRIIDCMKEEDKTDSYYSRSEKTRAENIDALKLHYNYLYGLALKITSSKKYSVLQDIHRTTIDELIYGNKSVDEYGGWYPYRIPWITARILISFSSSNYSERKDADFIDGIIHKALDSLIRRIYEGKYWRSGVGIWVSKWESTSLCLEALDRWDYITKHKSEIKEVLNYILNNENDWMVTPSFETEEQSNDTLASVILICIVYKLCKRNYGVDEISLDIDKYLKYLDGCIDIIGRISDTNIRQFCTIPQIAYYVVDTLTER